MNNNWLFFDPYWVPTDPLLSCNGIDNYSIVHGTVALREAFTCFSKLAGAFIFWCSGKSNFRRKFRHVSRKANSNSNIPFDPCSVSFHGYLGPLFLQKVSSLSVEKLFRRARKGQSMIPVFSLASALIPPFDNLISILGITSGEGKLQMLGSMDQRPCSVEHQGCVDHPLTNLNWVRHIIEPKTGIEFPGMINTILPKENQSSLSSEVLVGTGSRTMTIIKIKTLKVYAFGFYVQPYSVCTKLGPKYASFSVAELKQRDDFYKDLLREDIGMTVRLIVNCNGMKINTVRDAFEKSLRARLVRTNPETDFECIAAFNSLFTKDIPLPAGTKIDVRRTADGQLITEIGGNQIGAVRSRDLCRAFFDMYIGEGPVSDQTKEEIGTNVASIFTRC